jgi:RNA polymerase sigma factor (sigma-70 family)
MTRFDQVLIRRKVEELIDGGHFTAQDRDDLRQQLWLRLLERLPAFDPQQSHRNAFDTMVIERCAANAVRDRRAPKRNPGGTCSLDVLVEAPGEDCCDLAALIGQREYDARRGRSPRSREELTLLARDLADVQDTLNPEEWLLAELLKTQSVSEAARTLGVRRTTLYGWIHRLRQRFEQAGLQNYL